MTKCLKKMSENIKKRFRTNKIPCYKIESNKNKIEKNVIGMTKDVQKSEFYFLDGCLKKQDFVEAGLGGKNAAPRASTWYPTT